MKKKILLTIHHHLNKNAGASKVALELQDYSFKSDFEINIISLDNIPLNSKFVFLKQKIIFPFFVLIYYLFNFTKYEIIECLSFDGWLAFPLLRICRKIGLVGKQLKMISYSVGLEHTYFYSKKKFEEGERFKISDIKTYFTLSLVTLAMRNADCVFVMNNDDLKIIDKKRLCNRKAIKKVIPHGLDFQSFKKPNIKRDRETKNISIVFIGSFEKRKGSEYLNLIATKLFLEKIQFHILILGSGKTTEFVKNKFTTNIRSRILNIPRFNNKKLFNILKNYKIIIFPSTAEGFGIALLEAMRCGLCPIAFSCGGPRDILKSAPEKVLAPNGDVIKFNQNLLRIIKSKKKLLRMRKWSYQKSLEYSLNHIWNIRESAYKTILINDKNIFEKIL